MVERRCPNCNELVPSTSITCPKCYKRIPVEEYRIHDETTYNQDGSVHRETRQRTVNQRTALLLALIPGLVGLLGIGMLYRNPRDTRALGLLALGLAVFIIANSLLFLTAGLSLVFVIPMILFYLLLYLGNLFLTVLGGGLMAIRL